MCRTVCAKGVEVGAGKFRIRRFIACDVKLRCHFLSLCCALLFGFHIAIKRGWLLLRST